MMATNKTVDDVLENTEQFPNRDKVKCVCEKDEVKCFCKDCRQFLCTSCSNHHTKYPAMANHRLQSLEDMPSKALKDDLLVYQQAHLCLIHHKTLEFFCTHNKILICKECKKTNHIPIRIPETFEQFKKTATKLKEDTNDFRENLERGVEKVHDNEKKLQKSKATCLKDIDDAAQELINKINDNKNEMKNKVETIYKNKKKVNNTQIHELITKITDVEQSLSDFNQLLEGNETTALQSSNAVYETLKKKISESPNTEPNDNGQIYFIKNMSLLQMKCDIGNVSERITDCLELIGGEDVTQGQKIVVEVKKTAKCKINGNQLTATWTHPTGETTITQAEDDDSGDFTVTETCTSPGVCILDVSIDGTPIKKSPMKIKVETKGLVNTIEINEDIVSDVVLYDEDSMLVSCRTKDILRYKQSGEYIEKVTLPECVKVNRMFKMKNGDIAFSDYGNKCITLIDIQNDQVVKSIGQGKLTNPKGLHVDDSMVYVADWKNICVLNIDNGQMIWSISNKCNVPDLTLTKEGNVIVLYNQKSYFTYYNSLTKQYILQLFDNNLKFLENIVKADKKADRMWKPRGVIVDADDNIIISSEHKLILFSRDGNFIKRIDKEDDRINSPWGLSISNHPRRVVVANKGNATIQIYNY